MSLPELPLYGRMPSFSEEEAVPRSDSIELKRLRRMRKGSGSSSLRGMELDPPEGRDWDEGNMGAAYRFRRVKSNDSLTESGDRAVRMSEVLIGDPVDEEVVGWVEALGTLFHPAKTTKVQMRDQELMCELPLSLCELRNLRFLTLINCKLSGTIPGPLMNLYRLQRLDLAENKLSGSIPTTIDTLSNLESLDLSGNSLSGAIPPSIGSLHKLVKLDLSKNELTGPIPESLGNCLELRKIYLFHNKLSGEIPESLYRLRSLRKLFLNENELTGEISPEIGNLVMLEELGLSQLKLSGSIPPSIGNLGKLQILLLDPRQLIFYEKLNPTCLPTDVCKNRIEYRHFLPGGRLYEEKYANIVRKFFLSDLMGPAINDDGEFVKSKSSLWDPYQFFPVINDDEKWNRYPYKCAEIVLMYPDLFARCKKPVIIINRYFNFILDVLRHAIHLQNHELVTTELDVLLLNINLLIALYKAASAHPSEESDLLRAATRVEDILLGILDSPSLDIEEILLKCLSASDPLTDATGTGVVLPGYYVMRAVTLTNPRNALSICLDRELKFIFGHPNIGSLLDTIFRSHAVVRAPGFLRLALLMNDDSDETIDVGVTTAKLRWLTYSLWLPRYSPAFMFFLDFVSKSLTLILVAILSVHNYNMKSISAGLETLEVFLLFQTVGSILYDIGQILNSETGSIAVSIQQYMSYIWNVLDLLYMSSLVAWAIFTSYAAHSGGSLYYAKLCLSISAIPMSLTLLQFLSVEQGLGRLVIIIRQMLQDLSSFTVVYLVCTAGFCIFFQSLFPELPAYSTTGSTMLTLYQAILATFDFSSFVNLQNSVSAGAGIIALALYLAVSVILLLNLLVARFSSTHQRIVEKSVEEWFYNKADSVKNCLILYSRSPLSMLPAPLNLLVIVCSGFGLFQRICNRRYGISFYDTFSNFIIAIILAVPRSILNVVKFSLFCCGRIWDSYQGNEAPRTVLVAVVGLLGLPLFAILSLVLELFIRPVLRYHELMLLSYFNRAVGKYVIHGFGYTDTDCASNAEANEELIKSDVKGEELFDYEDIGRIFPHELEKALTERKSIEHSSAIVQELTKMDASMKEAGNREVSSLRQLIHDLHDKTERKQLELDTRLSNVETSFKEQLTTIANKMDILTQLLREISVNQRLS